MLSTILKINFMLQFLFNMMMKKHQRNVKIIRLVPLKQIVRWLYNPIIAETNITLVGVVNHVPLQIQ